MQMNSNYFMNSGRATFSGGQVRSPRASERSGAVGTKSVTPAPQVKVKTYSVTVKDGALKIDQKPRKIADKQA